MTAETAADTGAVGLGRGGRMSRPRKHDAVLPPLRGESLKSVSRCSGVTAAALPGRGGAISAPPTADLTVPMPTPTTVESGHPEAAVPDLAHHW